ncbi:hypothetical protein C8F01DRAFT_1252623 [Mycena amicta]|nr:hypothetical protein C8F01DRAFT_1252623 [Mycena amicta]
MDFIVFLQMTEGYSLAKSVGRPQLRGLAPFKATQQTAFRLAFPHHLLILPYRMPMITGISHSSAAIPAGTRARDSCNPPRAGQQPRLCHSFVIASSARTSKTQSFTVSTDPSQELEDDDDDESMGVVEEDTMSVGSDVDWQGSTLMGPDTRLVAMDLDLFTWPTRSPSASATPSPATSFVSLDSTTTSTSTSSSSSESSRSSIPTSASVPTTGPWAHLPPPPGYIPDQKRKTAYKVRQRLAHLEADEFCTDVRETAVFCRGCRKDIALDGRFSVYPSLWLKHRGKCVGVQMLALGYDPTGTRGQKEAVAMVQLRTGKTKRYQRKSTAKAREQTPRDRLEAIADAARFKALTAPRRRPTSSPIKILPRVAQPALAARRQACPLSKILC